MVDLKNTEAIEQFHRFNLYEHHFSTKYRILLSYKGPFDRDYLKVIGKYIKQILDKDPRMGKKLFNIFIELAQNISYYSYERVDDKLNSGIGSLVILESKEHYYLYTGNVIRNEDADKLIDKCEMINSLDSTGLRELKRKQYEEPPTDHRGANIGLIQVAITSANPVIMEFSPVDEESSFFALAVKVDRQK
jgi:hypothetical protein